MSVLPATVLLPQNADGRRFSATRTVRLGDVGADGELRLDAIARYLQDVAGDDALDAGLPNAMGWVVRRTMLRVDVPCTLNEPVTLTTFCTGAGRSWAERRTSLVGALGGRADAVSLWVQIDVESGRPQRLGDDFARIYGGSAAGRTVSSKLSLPAPPGSEEIRPWQFRSTDLDPFAHVNNAAQWVVVDDLVAGDRGGTAEYEYLSPVGLGEVELRVAGRDGWLVDEGRVLSAFRWSPASV